MINPSTAATSIKASGLPDRSARAPKVLISILNWNGAKKTLKCLASIQDQIAHAMAASDVLVIDNGSREEDFAILKAGMAPYDFILERLPHNLGFTGGHNISIQRAIQEGYDFIWLVNNDATIESGALNILLSTMHQHPDCGAVSPILRDIDDGTIARCVNTHDWVLRASRRIVSIDEARQCQDQFPKTVWVDGTAILFRVRALNDVGPLDDRLFAYYDDNDIGVRLANHGWFSRCAFDAIAYHENKKSVYAFPLYLTYLLQRNDLLFWQKSMPKPYRKWLWLKMVDRALFDVSRQYKHASKAHGDAALLGLYDFLRNSYGPPAYERRVPLFMRAACKLSSMVYAKKL